MGNWCLHASSFILIKSSLKLLVTRTGIKAQSSSILGRIRPLILEFLALEWRKFHTFELEYLWSQLANLDQILCVASLGWGKGCISFGADWPWHIGLRWAIVALWATCSYKEVCDLKSQKLWLHVLIFEQSHEETWSCHMQTTKVRISLCIRTVWSAPLLFAA